MNPVRDPTVTRRKLVEAAFHEIYSHGFQSASLDRILEAAGVTKGALYHHFENKTALGYAVVDELIAGWIRDRWVTPLEKSEDPVTTLVEIMRGLGAGVGEEVKRNGCPLNNLVNEMSAIDDGFRLRLSRILDNWRSGIAEAFARGQGLGTVRRDIVPRQAATVTIALFEGITGLMKNAQSRECMHECAAGFVSYLEGLRPAVSAGTEET